LDDIRQAEEAGEGIRREVENEFRDAVSETKESDIRFEKQRQKVDVEGEGCLVRFNEVEQKAIFSGVRIVNAAQTELQQKGDRLNNEETDRDRRRGQLLQDLPDAFETSPINRALLDISVADSNDNANVDRDELHADEHNPDCHIKRTIWAPEDKRNERKLEIERLVIDIREKVEQRHVEALRVLQ
jgi:hypothetical protein